MPIFTGLILRRFGICRRLRGSRAVTRGGGGRGARDVRGHYSTPPRTGIGLRHPARRPARRQAMDAAVPVHGRRRCGDPVKHRYPPGRGDVGNPAARVHRRTDRVPIGQGFDRDAGHGGITLSLRLHNYRTPPCPTSLPVALSGRKKPGRKTSAVFCKNWLKCSIRGRIPKTS